MAQHTGSAPCSAKPPLHPTSCLSHSAHSALVLGMRAPCHREFWPVHRPHASSGPGRCPGVLPGDSTGLELCSGPGATPDAVWSCAPPPVALACDARCRAVAPSSSGRSTSVASLSSRLTMAPCLEGCRDTWGVKGMEGKGWHQWPPTRGWVHALGVRHRLEGLTVGHGVRTLGERHSVGEHGPCCLAGCAEHCGPGGSEPH